MNFILMLLPSLAVILGIYLIIFRQAVAKYFKLNQVRPIIFVAVTLIILAVAGFFIVSSQVTVLVVIWGLMLVALLAVFASLLFVSKKENEE